MEIPHDVSTALFVCLCGATNCRGNFAKNSQPPSAPAPAPAPLVLKHVNSSETMLRYRRLKMFNFLRDLAAIREHGLVTWLHLSKCKHQARRSVGAYGQKNMNSKFYQGHLSKHARVFSKIAREQGFNFKVLASGVKITPKV